MPQSVAKDLETLARFECEAKAVAALSHPNILAIHDFGDQDGIGALRKNPRFQRILADAT